VTCWESPESAPDLGFQLSRFLIGSGLFSLPGGTEPELARRTDVARPERDDSPDFVWVRTGLLLDLLVGDTARMSPISSNLHLKWKFFLLC
jgi:hypothetical protein